MYIGPSLLRLTTSYPFPVLFLSRSTFNMRTRAKSKTEGNTQKIEPQVEVQQKAAQKKREISRGGKRATKKRSAYESLPFLNEVDVQKPKTDRIKPSDALWKAWLTSDQRPLSEAELRSCYKTCANCTTSYLNGTTHQCGEARPSFGKHGGEWWTSKEDFLKMWARCGLCKLFTCKSSFAVHEKTCPKIAVGVAPKKQ
ncbi:hypothetical protein PsYK624_171020 [Phanerochaete sordida]|uniref:Uncharacterized protein n=1 Tax=Phanerochaete sordida TaxID=48140 RepID=A0A9P3GYX4_9APHY|nr:hypothetical protein PsYK624_171020 [Phanerochaete sordida]